MNPNLHILQISAGIGDGAAEFRVYAPTRQYAREQAIQLLHNSAFAKRSCRAVLWAPDKNGEHTVKIDAWNVHVETVVTREVQS